MEQVEENLDAGSDLEKLTANLLDKKQEQREQKSSEGPPPEESEKKEPEGEEPEEEVKKEPKSDVKKFVFTKGDKTYELDEDAEFEMMADKKPIKLTLKQLKERAAGDIAVKNRMHSLAEEKKRVQATFQEFANIAKNDPLGALEYISEKAKETDSEFEYQKYLNKLGEQAEKLGAMDESERKAWELEKKLNKANKDLSQKDRETNVVRKKQEILERFPEVGDQKFDTMIEAVMSNETLMAECKNEADVLHQTEKLIEETFIQADIADLIAEFDPARASDNELIFALRDQYVQNPEYDEDDMRDLVKQVIGPAKKERAARNLSSKQRASTSVEEQNIKGLSDMEILSKRLVERKNKEKK